MNTINLTDDELEWMQSAIVAKAIEVAEHAEKYPSPATRRTVDTVNALRDRFLEMTEEPAYYGSRGDREDFHSDG